MRRGLGGLADHVATSIAGLLVPVHLDAALRQRESVVTGSREVGQAIAVRRQRDVKGTLLGRGIDRLQSTTRPMALVHGDLVAARVALEHRQLAGRELVLVLLGIGGGDDEQRLLAFERIAEEAIAVHWRRTRLQPAGPGRDAAIGIAFLLRAQRSERGAELVSFLLGDGGHSAVGVGQQGQRDEAAFDDQVCVHVFTLCQLRLRSSRRS
ncbi:hypothetical protein D9M68_640250 [compost metagenome]